MKLESLLTKDNLAARFAEQDARVDTRFAHMEAKMDSNHRVFLWTQAIVVAAVLIPYFERLMAL